MCFFFQIPGELGGSGLDPGGISVQSADRPPPAAGGMAGGFMVGARHVTSWPRPQVPLILSNRVSDPNSFATGPDPAF